MNLLPLYDKILVERISEQASNSGLYIPDSAKEKPTHGVVIAAGIGRMKDDGTVTPLQVKVGDKILFGKYAGTDIKQNEKEYLMMREEDVLAIIKEAI